MNRTIILLLVALVMGTSPSVRAHSWYPKECCSNHDCMQADSLYTDAGGNRIVTIGHRRVWIPRDFAVRVSPDSRIHICFTDDTYGTQTLWCVFMPSQA